MIASKYIIIALHRTTLHYTTLHYTTLHYTTLHTEYIFLYVPSNKVVAAGVV